MDTPAKPKKLTIRDFYLSNKEELGFVLLNFKDEKQQRKSKALKRSIKEPRIFRPGLALTGFLEVFTSQRLQILGNTEIAYLNSLTSRTRRKRLRAFFDFSPPAVVLSNGNTPCMELLDEAVRHDVALLGSPMATNEILERLQSYLSLVFAPRKNVHGSLVDVYGLGILITGRSGIGKSEVALDLVERGHRLVSDDLVLLERTAPNLLMGSSPNMLKHMMEIRGLGIINVEKIFGIRAIRMQKRVEMEVHLVDWDETRDYDRTGLDEATTDYLEVTLPRIELPIFPGKNITVICETLALNQILKVHGYNAAEEFNKKLIAKMQEHRERTLLDKYLEFDTE